MAWRRFYRRSKKGASKRKTRVRKSNPGKQLVTKSQLYRAIRRKQEVKQVNFSSTLTYYNADMTQAGDLKPLLPSVAQGTDNQNRIGQEINPIKLVVRGYVIYNLNAAAATAQSDAKFIRTRHLIWQNRAVKSYNIAQTNYTFLENGTPTNFTGTPIQLTYPLNKDDFVFYMDKQHTFLKPWGRTAETTPSATNTVTSLNGSLFYPFTYTFTSKNLPAKLLYQDGSNIATNFAPMMTLGYADLFNASPDVANTQVAMEYTSTLYFTDS